MLKEVCTPSCFMIHTQEPGQTQAVNCSRAIVALYTYLFTLRF